MVLARRRRLQRLPSSCSSSDPAVASSLARRSGPKTFRDRSGLQNQQLALDTSYRAGGIEPPRRILLRLLECRLILCEFYYIKLTMAASIAPGWSPFFNLKPG